MVSTADPSGAVLSNTHGLWQQCEALRALWRYAYTYRNPLALAHVDKAFEFYRKTFADEKRGGVFAGPIVDGELKSRPKATAGSWIIIRQICCWKCRARMPCLSIDNHRRRVSRSDGMGPTEHE